VYITWYIARVASLVYIPWYASLVHPGGIHLLPGTPPYTTLGIPPSRCTMLYHAAVLTVWTDAGRRGPGLNPGNSYGYEAQSGLPDP